MINFSNLRKHLHLIGVHRRKVCYMCFKMGIPLQGLLHDLSKYSIRELSIYKYYDGTRSPHEKARDELGFSPSWISHRSKNKHHWEYWLDNNSDYNFIPIKIPYKYVIEMFCDMVGAGKAYMRDKWTPEQPEKYFKKWQKKRLYHKDTEALLLLLFRKLKLEGEIYFLNWYKVNKSLIQSWYERGNCSKSILKGSDIHGE